MAALLFFAVLCLGQLSALESKASEGQYQLNPVACRLGFNFFAWETPFLLTGVDLRVPLQEALYANLGGDFGIHTRESNGEVKPDFLFPLRAGLVFPFPSSSGFSYAFASGISPVFLFASENAFYIGPYAQAELSIAVHPVLSVNLLVRQSLLFGGDEWVSTGTEISAGISF